MVTGLWTILTLGFYRFWMKTRLRRHYWSAVRPGGVPLEYVGDPLEKLLGFLIAVVIVAFYVGVVNLLLMFGSLSLFASNATAYALSFVGVIPLWFYARYRARRYVLARTRWRGIRFGLEPGAWGYAWRALLHWVAVILTLGLWWPRMTFALEKYRTDRTYYGDLRLHQGGSAGMLYPGFVHAMIGGFFTGAALLLSLAGSSPGFAWLLFVSVPWLLFGIAYYRVQCLRLLTDTKTAGGLSLTLMPDVTTVMRIYGFGYLATVLILIFPLAVVLGLVNAVQAAQYSPYAQPGLLFGLPVWVFTVLGIVTYFAFFLMWSVFRHIYVTQPLWQHYAERLRLTGAAQLAQVHQRDRDHFREAEGFAEALDVGAAI